MVWWKFNMANKFNKDLRTHANLVHHINKDMKDLKLKRKLGI